MDGVERIMVLGIFAVIVSILGVAAWSVTQDGGVDPVGAADGGALAGSTLIVGTPLDPPGMASASDREKQREAQRLQRDALLGHSEREAAKKASRKVDLTAKSGSGRAVPSPTSGPRGPASRGSEQPLHLSNGQGATDPFAAPQQSAVPSAKTLDRPADRTLDQNAGRTTDRAVEPGAHAPVATSRSYTVQEGDTYWGLARREFDGKDTKRFVQAIQALNASKDLVAGDVIKLPLKQALKQPVATQGAVSDAAAKAQPAAPKGYRYYTVQQGDLLSRIADRELGSSSRTDELFELNSDTLESADSIQVGQRLLIPVE